MPVFPAVPSTTVPPGFRLPTSGFVRCYSGQGKICSPALLLCISNDTECGSIFNTPSRILELGFAEYT